jgi:predicted transcriptional regulator
MKNAIEEVRDLLDHLPEDADFETIIAKLYFRMQVYRGLDDIENGRVVDDEEIEKEFG